MERNQHSAAVGLITGSGDGNLHGMLKGGRLASILAHAFNPSIQDIGAGGSL